MSEIKRRLEKELSSTIARLRQHGAGAVALEDIGGGVGEAAALADEGDLVRLNADREMSFATRSLLVERANRLADALERLREGEYGICQECSEPIAPARLRAMPEVTTCVRCQDRLERSGYRLQPVGAGFDDDEIDD
jgi:RNA polymerase-binding transcription factor DksA